MTLECRATGNPAPVITWVKESSALPSGELSMAGPAVTISEIAELSKRVFMLSC